MMAVVWIFATVIGCIAGLLNIASGGTIAQGLMTTWIVILIIMVLSHR